MPDSLEDLRHRLAQFAQEREWDQFHSPKNLAMAPIAETAELVEHFQWLSEEDSRSLSSKKRQTVGEELTDILIYIVLRPDDIDGVQVRVADTLDIDLLAAAKVKIEKNERRYPAVKYVVEPSGRRSTNYE